MGSQATFVWSENGLRSFEQYLLKWNDLMILPFRFQAGQIEMLPHLEEAHYITRSRFSDTLSFKYCEPQKCFFLEYGPFSPAEVMEVKGCYHTPSLKRACPGTSHCRSVWMCSFRRSHSPRTHRHYRSTHRYEVGILVAREAGELS